MIRANVDLIKTHIKGAKLIKTLYNIPNKNTIIRHDRKRKSLFLVIQGTNTLYHWIHNISLLPTKDEGLHRGFKSFAHLCRDELIDDLYELVNKDNLRCEDIQSIIFSSHSLGGSATIILVYEIMKNDYLCKLLSDKKIDIVLFGAPMSGNYIFIQNFKKKLEEHKNIKIYRYNMKYDFIKYYPPVFMYSHVGEDITLHNDELKIQQFVYNHSINCYIKNLEEYNIFY